MAESPCVGKDKLLLWDINVMSLVSTNENTSIMDKGQALDIARKYKAMVAEHLPLKALYLYGSYSKGNYTEESDIDIAVVV